MKVRRRARIVALQALFEIDSAGHNPDTVLKQRLEDRPLPSAGAAFAEKLVHGVLAHKATLDDFIQRNAPQWPVSQMAVVDRNVLRIALFELLLDRTTPVKVAINEAVEMAKIFGSESSHRFVNGVLGSVVAQMQASGHISDKMTTPGQRAASEEERPL